MKGSAASKKLAAHGRSSSKAKASRQPQLPASRLTTQVPRYEVYPSALKDGKPSVSGSVVSQKPPSKRI